MQAHPNTVDPSEIAKFEAMAAEWWDPHGKFKPLHMLNPCRLDYITQQIAGEFDRDLKSPMPFEGLRLLDIGCGGGLLSEPMARLGAEVVGADAAEGNLPGIGAYNIAKRALEHLARQLAQEAPQITSLVFRPGATETRMQEQAREAEGGAAKVLHREFRGYLQRGVLDTPEQAARRLLKFILNDPRRHHGRIVT